MKTVLAADLGGTKCRFALVAEDLSVHAPRVIPTPKDREDFLAAMDREFDALRGTLPANVAAPSSIGIGVAGIVQPDRRGVATAPNLPIAGFALAGHLERRHGLPATLLNDGRASAFGEYLGGSAKGADPLLVLFFGTGIGIGLIERGEPYAGATNAAGEVGHTPFIPGGRRCVCGNRGCYEAYCGGGPIGARAEEELGPSPTGRWTVDVLLGMADRDARAKRILDDAERAAGAMVAGLCTLLNPAAVVLGGGLLEGWPALATKIEAFTRAWCTDAVERHLVFARSLAGSDAILWGAARATGQPRA